MAPLVSAGSINSSALSKTLASGLVASSQNCWRQLADQSARRPLVETVLEMTGYNLGHFNHLESGTLYFVAHSFLVGLSSLDLNVISIKAPPASDN